ncbi:MFS transporter [Pseudonocardia sp. C8]|uniref:MFS transporter n=1 Tax=Pseudonocardia sp. C8 TaxID=2762759 RepID=UPI001643698A|nr:MFS transporter [Pseudonocardia sp. C8]MBC3194512.1 MFS transporter [Pseudonocardia sp. C8]
MTPSSPSAPLGRRRAIVGGTIGHAIEFFDFTVYGFLAVYIGKLFFPSGDATAELLSSFAVFGLAFFARPLGGFVFGPLADRIGRKRVLVLVLTLMSVCSVLIGLLPTYASIGLWAPVLLVVLRCLQGFSAGGEYASGSAFLLEYAGRGRRAFGMSWLTFATTLGLAIGTLAVTGVSAAVGAEAMAEWGWRIPFLLAAPLAGVAFWIRIKLEDTPEFTAMADEGTLDPNPVRTMFAERRPLWIIVGIGAFHTASFYGVFTYLPTYIGTVNKYGATFALVSTLITAVAVMITLPVVATLSDRIGRKPVLLGGSVAFAAAVYPVFMLITVGVPAVAMIGQLLLGVLAGFYLAASAVAMPELFPAPVRGTGVAIGFNVPNAVFGGSAPFIATFLIQQTGHIASPAWYLLALAVAAAATAFVLRRGDLHDDGFVLDHEQAAPRRLEDPA